MRRQVTTLSSRASVGLGMTLCVLLIAGCGRGEGPSPKPVTYEDKINEGWQAFNQGVFNQALRNFQLAATMDETRPEAYDGMGWCYALLDSLSMSVAAFETTLVRDGTLLDPHMGMAAVLLDLPDYQEAINHALYVLSADHDFVFTRRSSYDWRDIRLILAECYYAQAQLDSAYDEVRMLDATFHLDPYSATYARDLLQKIEDLVALHGGF